MVGVGYGLLTLEPHGILKPDTPIRYCGKKGLGERTSKRNSKSGLLRLGIYLSNRTVGLTVHLSVHRFVISQMGSVSIGDKVL